MIIKDDILLLQLYEQISTKSEKVNELLLPGQKEPLRPEDILIYTDRESSPNGVIEKRLQFIIDGPLYKLQDNQKKIKQTVIPGIFKEKSLDPEVQKILDEAVSFTVQVIKEGLQFPSKIPLYFIGLKFLGKTTENKNIFQYKHYSVPRQDVNEAKDLETQMLFDIFHFKFN